MNVKPGINIWSIRQGHRKAGFLLVLLLFSQVRISGQNFEINAVNEPLSQVLMELARDYGIQLSFDDKQLSAYTINLQKSFNNPEEAIAFLIKDYPLDFKQIGDVFTLYSTRTEKPQSRHNIVLTPGKHIKCGSLSQSGKGV